MSEAIYYLSEKEGLQHDRKVIIKKPGKPAPLLPDGLSSDLLKMLKKEGRIGSLKTASENVVTDPEKDELTAKLKASEERNSGLTKMVREKNAEVDQLMKDIDQLMKDQISESEEFKIRVAELEKETAIEPDARSKKYIDKLKKQIENLKKRGE